VDGSWSPATSPALLAAMSACSIPSTRPVTVVDPIATSPVGERWACPPDDAWLLNSDDLAHNPEVAGSNPAPATSKCRSGA